VDDSCNDKDKKNSDGKNKGEKYDQFETNINKTGMDWEKEMIV
jgi:hypothetical protein